MSTFLHGPAPPPVPDGLAALLAGHGPGAPPPDQDDQGGGDKGLQALQEIIDEFPDLLVAVKDPTDVHDATTCLRVLTGIQKRMMGGAAGGKAAPPAGY